MKYFYLYLTRLESYRAKATCLNMDDSENRTGSNGIKAAADYEYHALMRLLSVSVSKHLLDENYTLVWANDYYYRLIGWPKDEYEATFKNQPILYYANYQKEWNELVETVTSAIRANQNGYNLVTTMPRKDGSRIWVNISSVFSEEYVNGYPVSYTVITNIDEQVRMQREQSIAYDNLPGFVAKFQINEDNFKFLGANERFKDFFDIRNELLFGLSNVNSEKNRITYQKNFPLMRKGERVHFTLQALNKTGGDLWLQVNAECIEWINGNPVYLVIYIDITDITEQRELQKQLEERSLLLHDALEAAERANRSKSEFLSRMSHDIRTPMNAIIGMTAIAGNHIDDKDRVKDCLGKITLSSKLLLGLINEVLDMSRIESGNLAITEEEFCLNDMLQNMVSVLHPSIMAKQHTFDIRAHHLRHEHVIGDPQHIQQVFLNILSNAVKYTSDGGKIMFDIREKPSNKAGYGLFEFTFEDNGYGMKPEFIEKLFSPFERANDAAILAVQGSGLGMAICRNIVTLMDGKIKVKSTYRKGSTFTVELPLKLQSNNPVDHRFSVKQAILVVDDDQIACETTCERLDEMGLENEWVVSGAQAIKKVASRHESGKDFSLIIIDMKMPEMDGIETTRLIRELIGPGIPILLASAYDWTEYESKALASGADGFLIKPMLKSTLAYAIKKHALKEEERLPVIPPSGQKRIYKEKRILLVEDNELNREIAEVILTECGIIVETATNGQDAFDKFISSTSGYYDLIFMDLQMPVMGGLESTQKIRSLSRKDAQTIPIVAMTANAFREDIVATKKAGMNAHLAKPLDIEHLYQILDRYIHQ